MNQNAPLLERKYHGSEPEEVESVGEDIDGDVEVLDTTDVGCLGTEEESKELERVVSSPEETSADVGGAMGERRGQFREARRW